MLSCSIFAFAARESTSRGTRLFYFAEADATTRHYAAPSPEQVTLGVGGATRLAMRLAMLSAA